MSNNRFPVVKPSDIVTTMSQAPSRPRDVIAVRRRLPSDFNHQVAAYYNCEDTITTLTKEGHSSFTTERPQVYSKSFYFS